ncbi:hypothetical protein BS17DRAFT_771614 [Gyrodon lividus]|nr:hypothetical protein BS17DRAFT_771614 [Gyrodon lividus]
MTFYTKKHLSSPLDSICSVPHWNLMQRVPFYSDECRESIPCVPVCKEQVFPRLAS